MAIVVLIGSASLVRPSWPTTYSAEQLRHEPWAAGVANDDAADTTGSFESWIVRFGADRIELSEGEDSIVASSEAPVLVQFYSIPDQDVVDGLKKRGVTLVRYAGAKAYIATCLDGCSRKVFAGTAVRALSHLSRAMRYSRLFESDPELSRRAHSGAELRVEIAFFPGVSWDQARTLLATAGITLCSDGFTLANSVSARASWERLTGLLEGSQVMFVDPSLPPAGPANADASQRVLVDRVRGQSAYLEADGSGVNVGVLDWFPARIHADLEGRVTMVRVESAGYDHGQMVSGTLAGSGLLDPAAEGMAPGARLLWHEARIYERPWIDTDRLHTQYGASISNNSWTIFPGWQTAGEPTWNGNTWAWGYYHELAAGADELARSKDILLVCASGNQRQYSFLGPHRHGDLTENSSATLHECLHEPNPLYSSISGAANAKNVLVVGGVTKDEMSACFSSAGPTGDGRIKPDVVAPSVDLRTTVGDDGYAAFGGTSVSTPVVSGAAALLTDFFERRHGRRPRALTLKNLLIHSARDLGVSGPDYLHGYGLIDAELAARIVDAASFSAATGVRRPSGRIGKAQAGSTPPSHEDRKDGVTDEQDMTSWILSGQIAHGERLKYFVFLPDEATELRATLVWHDPPGEALVNDLDLRLLSPTGERIEPFLLDPRQPAVAADRGRNTIDNVEHVVWPLPDTGTWTAVVEGERIAIGPQQFSLIVSASDGNRPLEESAEGACRVLDFFLTSDVEESPHVSPRSVFCAGDPMNAFFALAVPENAEYATFFGSMTQTLSITDATGNLIVKVARATHSIPGSLPPSSVFANTTFSVPAAMPPGRYTAHLVCTMGNGFEDRSEWPFMVQ